MHRQAEIQDAKAINFDTQYLCVVALFHSTFLAHFDIPLKTFVLFLKNLSFLQINNCPCTTDPSLIAIFIQKGQVRFQTGLSLINSSICDTEESSEVFVIQCKRYGLNAGPYSFFSWLIKRHFNSRNGKGNRIRFPFLLQEVSRIEPLDFLQSFY